MKRKLKYAVIRAKKMLFMMMDQFSDPFYQGVAAQIAFSLFLSIVPIFILMSQLLGLFSLPLAVIALWSSSRAQFAIMRVTNYTLTDGKVLGKGYVRDRLRSVRTILMTIFTIVFSLVVLVYGELILNLVFGAVVGQEISAIAWTLLRWPVAMALYFLMISYNYYILPTQRVPFRDIVPGSIFAAVGFLAVTYFYSIYTTISTNYNILYGSFSNIVVLLFWFWFLAWVMCLGISFNRVWWATRRKNKKPIPEEVKARRKPLNIF